MIEIRLKKLSEKWTDYMQSPSVPRVGEIVYLSGDACRVGQVFYEEVAEGEYKPTLLLVGEGEEYPIPGTR